MKMKNIHILPLLLGLTGFVQLGAVQHTVLPTEKIQDYIDAAQAGDTIVIRAGTYNEDLTINKQLHLRDEEGGDVIITGKMTFENIPEKMALLVMCLKIITFPLAWHKMLRILSKLHWSIPPSVI